MTNNWTNEEERTEIIADLPHQTDKDKWDFGLHAEPNAFVYIGGGKVYILPSSGGLLASYIENFEADLAAFPD